MSGLSMKTRIDFRDQINRNKYKSVFLMICVFVILVLFGYVISFAFDPGFFFFIMILTNEIHRLT